MMGNLYQKKRNLHRKSKHSNIEMKTVTVKQRLQKARHQLPIAPLLLPMLATREKATHMEVACGRRRRQNHLPTFSSHGILPLVDMVL